MRVAPLLAILGVAWILVILESYAFFVVIVPLGPPIHDIGAFTLLALLKVGLTFGLGVAWFAAMFSLQQAYVRTRLRRSSS